MLSPQKRAEIAEWAQGAGERYRAAQAEKAALIEKMRQDYKKSHRRSMRNYLKRKRAENKG